jgi:hypothetical protein
MSFCFPIAPFSSFLLYLISIPLCHFLDARESRGLGRGFPFTLPFRTEGGGSTDEEVEEIIFHDRLLKGGKVSGAI